jgi:hypothetical protein
VTGHMVEHGLNDVRLHAKIGHAGGDGAAHVMQAPGSNVTVLVGVLCDCFIKRSLRL